MQVFSRLAVAIAATFVAAAAQAGARDDCDGRILFTRTILTPTNDGTDAFPSSAALFTVDLDGTHVHRLTPQQQGHFYLPGLESDTTVWGYGPVNWLSKNFSGGAKYVLYLDGYSSAFPTQQDSMSGKYKVMDMAGHSHALFPGPDDVNAGYGFPTWGPPGSNEIAYTNTAMNYPASPACVFLVHPDGTGARRLWCAANHSTPTSVSNLRWSGDGKSLLAYVNWHIVYETPPNWGSFSYVELWRINVTTGSASRVSSMISDPPLGDSADISYDGNEVIYEEYAPFDSDAPACDPDMQGDGSGYTVCARNMSTGKTTVLWNEMVDTYLQLVIAPDGKHMAASTYNNPEGTQGSESDLYLVSTADGSVVRQLTRRPAAGLPDGASVIWKPVAWSRDGKHLLVNRFYYGTPVENKITKPTHDIYIVDVTNGSARHVIAGNAEGWYQPN